MPGRIAPIWSCKPGRARSGRGGRPDRVDRVGLPFRRIADGRQQGEHFHGLKDVLRVGATAIVAAEREIDAGCKQRADRRDAVFVFQVAERVEDDARPGRGNRGDLFVAEPDAVRQCEARSEQADALQKSDQRTAEGLEAAPCVQRLGARDVDVRVDRKVVLAGELGQAVEQVVAAAFRTRRSDRPGREPAFVAAAKQFVHDAERIWDLGRRRRTAEGIAQRLGRNDFPPIGHCIHGRAVRHLQAENHPQSRFAVGRAHDVDLADRERPHGQHILRGGDAAADAFDGPQQRAQADLLVAAGRIGTRQRVQDPVLQDTRVEAAFEKDVMRMIVRVDKARHHQLAARIDDGGGRRHPPSPGRRRARP